MHRHIKKTFLAAGLAIAMLTACASHNPSPSIGTPPRVVWPAAPSEPRIAYLRDLRGPRDIGQNPSTLRSLVNWITGDSGESLNLRKPFAVALDEKGNLCLTDTDTRLVCYADFSQKKWRRYDGAGPIKFASPVAVARRNGVFYVADSELGKVFAFREDEKIVFEISAPLQRPVGLALTDNSLYVVDSQAHAVFVFDLEGKLKFQFGRRGKNPGEFNFPTCAAADGKGRLLVSDTMNCRVQIFDLRGNFLNQFGTNGDTSGHFARPKGIATDNADRIYAVDGLFDNFQIFSAEGNLLLNVGQGGVGPGGFCLPHGIAIGFDNLIYVADAFNHRIQVFKYIGQP